MEKMLDICIHNVPRKYDCVECRKERSIRRLNSLRGDVSRAAEHEVLMHQADIRLFDRMLKAGKRTL